MTIRRLCSRPGCRGFVRDGVCTECGPKRQDRHGAATRGYNYRWQKASRAFLMLSPLCVRCNRAASVVDHITPHHGNSDLFWDTDNWQPLCKPCHDAKTQQEDRKH